MSIDREEWVLAAPRNRVWEQLSRVDEWSQWMPGVGRIGGINENCVATTNAHYEASTGGFPLRQELSVDQMIPEEKIVITRRFPGMDTTSTYELSDDSSGGTKVIRTVETHGALSPLAGFVNHTDKSNIDTKLMRLLDKGSQVGRA